MATSTLLAGAVVALTVVTGCSEPSSDASDRTAPTTTATTPVRAGGGPTVEGVRTVEGMPEVVDATNLYGEAGAGALAPATEGALARVYVPNGLSGTVTVIDQRTKEVVATHAAGELPQHVVPSYDLSRLWVLDNEGNEVIPIDPRTSELGGPIEVDDPYNLYFTPDGSEAIVVAEERQRLDFRDPGTMALRSSLQLPCNGLNHVDFSIDGRYALATCEFGGALVKVDMEERRLAGRIDLQAIATDGRAAGSMSMPQDVRVSPDGSRFYVADMARGGVWVVDGGSLEQIGFVATGTGAHGLYPSRDGRSLYVANRGWDTIAGGRRGPGSVTVLDAESGEVRATWPVPGGGSPDMGNVSADGTELWLSGRFDAEVYVFDTTTGDLVARIPVGLSPHGLTVWPQPGRYSLGHTGNMR